MQTSFGQTFEKQVLLNVIDLGLLLREDEDRRRCLLQTLEQVHKLGLLLDKLHFLQHIKIGSTSATHVHSNGRHKRAVGEL